jgi:hypothetical protein
MSEHQSIVDAVTKLPVREQLAVAKMARAMYVESVRNTKIVLDPRLLRQMDAKIKETEAQLN